MQTETMRTVYPRAVQVWLATGVFLVFMQVVIGGVTRLTGSGLSITKWEIVTGTLPPLNEQAWEEAFALYKATPQYQKLNEGMSMGQFQFIYFWEYFHRLWARMMGFVFALPFFFFWRKGWIDKKLMRRLGVVILLAMLAASFGWIMVASGLVERPWVNAYKLTLHLGIALTLFSYLFWTMLGTFQPFPQLFHSSLLNRWALVLAVLLAVQILLGGVMSGMKAGLFFPTWPTMNGEWMPTTLLDPTHWSMANVVDYDRHLFMPALVQILHRTVAYILTIIVLWYIYKVLQLRAGGSFQRAALWMGGAVFVQILLGVLTVLNCLGKVPVGWGVFHQAGALILLSTVLCVNFFVTKEPQ
jgi:cytochrome c oxidase assembly protein subunit 15